jgi:hypothetical protein
MSARACVTRKLAMDVGEKLVLVDRGENRKHRVLRRRAPYVALEFREAQTAAHVLGLEVGLFEIRRAEDIAAAFEGIKGHAEALYIFPDPLLFTHRSYQYVSSRRAVADCARSS